MRERAGSTAYYSIAFVWLIRIAEQKSMTLGSVHNVGMVMN